MKQLLTAWGALTLVSIGASLWSARRAPEAPEPAGALVRDGRRRR